MFYLVRILRTSSLGGSISSNPERTTLRRRGDEPDYIQVLQQIAGRLNIKRLSLKKTRYPKLRNLVLSVYGKMQESGLTEIVPFHAPQLSGAGIKCFILPKLPWGSP